MKAFDGYSLVELLLVATLSLMLLAIWVGVYLHLHNAGQQQLALSHGQQNALTALSILNQEVKMAGYMGCQNRRTSHVKQTMGYPVVIRHPLTGTNDRFTIWHASAEGVSLFQPMQNNFAIPIHATKHNLARVILMIADCDTVEFFKAVHHAIHNNKIQYLTADHPLAKRYPKTAEVNRLLRNTFFLRQHVNGLFGLYQQDIGGHVQEIIAGVEQWQLQYVVIENNTLHQVRAAAVKDWSLVKAIVIQLRLHGIANGSAQTWYAFIALRE